MRKPAMQQMHLSIQEMKDIVNDRLDKGMSVKDYCLNTGYTESMYYHWVKAIHQKEPDFISNHGKISSRLDVEEDNTFIEISPKTGGTFAGHQSKTFGSHPPASDPMAVLQVGSVEIGILPNADASFMRQLLEAVRYA